eukprot:CAMPEP_0181310222 /NCGR_PEP_ID=MMETSP1101-20121128/12468_1 /TAXON_ID=46948 /ORGANISM="Rhodomonas abbreviata, Strain Caron Lab Isolate" /LENGTH=65 /DNA_ID=CAMNT_0023416831 /DNA_START=533 /DNA_END=730 /DNA_ORIENTATION=+
MPPSQRASVSATKHRVTAASPTMNVSRITRPSPLFKLLTTSSAGGNASSRIESRSVLTVRPSGVV